MNVYDAAELAYKNGYNVGKQDTVDRVIERVKAESALNIAGLIHYIVTDHDLKRIKEAILEGETNE